MNTIKRKVINPFLNLFKKSNSTTPNNLFRKEIGLDLKDIIYNSYHPKSNLNGFTRDDALSGHRQQVYINPDNKQLLYSVAGTRSGTDILNDLRLIGGGIKNTNRYRSADNTLKLAKDKYPEYATNIIGSSLGGAIASRIASRDDRVITYNSAEVFGKNRSNVIPVRHAGDVISLIGAPKSISFGNPLLLASPLNWLSSHSSSQL